MRNRAGLVRPAGGLALVRRTRRRLALRAAGLVVAVLAVLSAGVWLGGRQVLLGALHERLERAEQRGPGATSGDILGPLPPATGSPADGDPDGDRDFSIFSSPRYGWIAVLRGRDAAGDLEVLATPAADAVRALWIFALLLGGLTLAGGAAAFPAAYLLAGRALLPLEEAIRERSDFVALASHRLRTPLAVIRTSAELALAGQGVAPEEALRTVLAQGGQIEGLAARLSALARADGAPARSTARADLGALARAAVRDLQAAAAGGGVEMRVEGPGSLGARGPEAEVGDALSSVLENAVRFSPPGGRVSVRLGAAGRWAWVEIADQGPGIPAAELSRVTQPFVQGALGQSRGGTGLGLAIAAATARRLGGRLEIRSAPGEGTAVRVQLRRARP